MIAFFLPGLVFAPLIVPLERWILGVGLLGVGTLRVLAGLLMIPAYPVWVRTREPFQIWLASLTSNQRLNKWIADGSAAFAVKIVIFWICMALICIFSHPVAFWKIALLTLIYLGENLLGGGLSGVLKDENLFIGRIARFTLDWIHRNLGLNLFPREP